MKKILLAFCIIPLTVASYSWINKKSSKKHCVYRTIMSEDPVDMKPIYLDKDIAQQSIQEGLEWLKSAQQANGGWGCGLHARQDVKDPHAVATDPATTAVVAAAILRSGSTLNEGPYKKELNSAVEYLLDVLYYADPHQVNITQLTNTQIQRKLGQNIDLVLTTQFLSTLAEKLEDGDPKKDKILGYLDGCVDRIELAQSADGSLSGGTWAAVLQSSFASSALETANKLGVKVEEVKLEASRNYQASNYSLKDEEVKTADGAGIMLYSVSGSARATAEKAKEARQKIEAANSSGIIDGVEVNADNLLKIGIDEKEAMELNTAYQIYNAAKVKAQREDVMDGYGNNGGEEFLSYLQTGESLVVNEDPTWTNWYDNISKRMMDIQNEDGSWNGHHCITSPVFCTATCVSILSIQNDMEAITTLGN